MGRINLPYGPWKSLLVGNYEGKDVSIYVNPSKDMLYVVVDKDESGKTRGLVISVYRPFFVEEGDPVSFLSHISGHPTAVIKKWKGEVYRYILVPAGIKYIGVDPSELRSTVEEMVATLNRMEKNLHILGRTLGVRIKELPLLPKVVQSVLFSEPATIAGHLPAFEGKEEPEEEGMMALGMKKDGSPAIEPLVNMRRVVIYGHKEGRKRTFFVLIEEFLRHGINVIVITPEPTKYEGFSRAGKRTEVLKKLGIEAVGFSVERIREVVDKKKVKEVDAVLSGGPPEKEVFEKIVEIMKKLRIGESVDLNQADSYTLRARRYVDVVLSTLPEGEVTTSKYLKRSNLGTLYVLSPRKLEHLLHLLTLLSTLSEALKKRGRSDTPRVVVFFEEGERYLPRSEDLITKRLVSLVDSAKDFGLGWVVEAERDTLVNELLLAKTETKIGAIKEDDVGIRTIYKKPYRMNVRDFVTSIGEYLAPEASSQQVLPPDRT